MPSFVARSVVLLCLYGERWSEAKNGYIIFLDPLFPYGLDHLSHRRHTTCHLIDDIAEISLAEVFVLHRRRRWRKKMCEITNLAPSDVRGVHNFPAIWL